MRVRWGVMSTARINQLFLAGARESQALDIVAVASREESTARRYAAENDIGRWYGSYDALLGDPEVEAVYISLPNSLHLEWTVRALQAGKHVLCEKPLSRRRGDVERAFDTAEREGRLLMEAFMYRHAPQTSRLTGLIADGTIGDVRVIRASFSFRIATADDIRLSTELEGGALMDVGCYCVNAARFLAGEPERVSAEQQVGAGGVDLTFVGTMRFPSGVIAQFDAGLAMSERDALEVIGEHGVLFLDDPWHCRTPRIEVRRPSGHETIRVEPADPYQLEAENMSAAIRGQQSLLLDRHDAVGQASTIEALYRAADTGAAVSQG